MLLRVVAAMAVVLMMAALMIAAVVTAMAVLMIAMVTAMAVLPMMTAMAVLTAMTVLTVALAMTMMATLPSLSCSRETQTQSNGRDGQEREFHVRIYHALGAFPLEGCAINQVLPPWRATCASAGAGRHAAGIRLER